MAESQIITMWGASFLKGTWRYIRQTFSGCGQDSYSQAPSQNEDMASSALNVLPPLDGGFRPRWGYSLFAASLALPNAVSQSQPFFLYQSDTLNYRKYVLPQPTQIAAINEDGSSYVASLFTPQAQPRMVTSRSYGYFASGQGADLKKWSGDQTPTITNWGILAPAETVAPAAPTTFTDVPGPSGTAWSVVGATSSVSLPASNPAQSDFLTATGLGLSVAGGGNVNGVTVTFTLVSTSPGAAGASIAVALTYDGMTPGSGFKIFPFAPGTMGVLHGVQEVTLGSSSDSWNGTLTPAIVNSANFGVLVSIVTTNGLAAQFQVGNILVAVNAPEAMSLTTSGSGAINLVSGRIYYAIYENALTGHYSDLSVATASTGPLTNNDVVITNIPTSPDPQVTTVVLLATSDGGNEEQLYFVGQVANGTTTFTDNTPDTTLVLNNVYLETDATGDETGVSFNDPPPADLRFPIKHRGRLYGVSGVKNLFFSKADSELFTSTGLLVGKFEECWPPLNFIDISEGAEEILGLLSDGQVLYIGTERRIIRLFGDGPATYLQPEALFVGVGVLNQDVWQLVFLEGNPVGAMWLTHDYRVVGSDFNTYQDVGTPVQDILNSANTAVGQQANWAAFLQQNEFCLYVLAIATGANTQPDTLLVFDLKLRQWYVWRLADLALGAILNITFAGNLIQNVFSTATGQIYQFSPSQFQDRVGVAPQSFPITLQTSFTPMGDPAARKFLNEIEVMTGDPACLVTVEGASTRQDFLAPHQVIANAPLVLKPLGQYFTSLASRTTLDRYYRFTFNSTSSTLDELRGYNVEGTVLNRV